ncbi:RNA-binding protein 42 [Hydra vulgaris]|uniref:RNA-binding protein 42 n=1 Tax=Hydra vulgaris TaxID=6087 RepID=A0ABM4B7R0_HYDVU
MEDKRKRDLEDEMSRFESEISGNLPPPPKIPMLRLPTSTPSSQPSSFSLPAKPPNPPPRMPTFPPTLNNHMFHGLPSMDGLHPPGIMPPHLMVPPMMPPHMMMPHSGPSGLLPPSMIIPNFDKDRRDGKKGMKKEKKKTVVRVAGGTVWEDSTLLDWDPNDFRIFVGDLGNEVSDDALLRAFSKYPSLLRAKIVRDKKTKKTKGYGFVSFKDPQDYLKAMREMNGKYVGNRPIKLRKSSWKERNIGQARKKEKEKKKLGIR